MNSDKLCDTSKPNCRNADNHDLGPWEEFPVGNVPEVNGLWAQEVTDFVPTSAELLTIGTLGRRCDRAHACRMGERERFDQY